MASLARDYLACSASSASVERTFSAAADVCVPGRGSMGAFTISRCVGTQMWMKQGVNPDEAFIKSSNIVNEFIKKPNTMLG